MRKKKKEVGGFKMSRFRFNYKNKNYSLEVKECKNIFSQFLGLMFKKNSKSLLFIFPTLKRLAIHSFFCKPFIAIWFNENKVIDIKFVKSWRFFVKPDKKFNKLLEIPEFDKNFLLFTDDSRKI